MTPPKILFAKELRPGVIRELRGLDLPRGRAVELGAVVDGQRLGGSSVTAESAPLVLSAICAARDGTVGVHGVFVDGKYSVRVETLQRITQGTALSLQRVTEAGYDTGPALLFLDRELDPLEKAILRWLFDGAPS